ncbi:MAG TPA: murein biosynthesis integral membrane protein MurJ [Gaiellaceae bacterium]|nr:murein biosynthesis integral membrane protein MurJ [Gaiellaceae bacterium]
MTSHASRGGTPPRDPDAHAHRRRLVRSTVIFGAATGVSRVLGLVREIIAAYYFGSKGKINAFTIAFQVPNLVRALVADAALSSAFVPVFTELLEKGEKKRAWRVASSVFWLMLLGLGGLTALFIVLAPLVIAPFGNPGGDRALAIGLTRVLFPIVALLGVSGVIVGILNSYDEFSIPALAPVAWNVAIIAGLFIGVPQAHSLDTKLYVYAVAIVIGTVIQVLLPVPWMRGLDDRLRIVLDWRDPAVKQVFVLMIPVTLSLGLINFNALVDSLFASRLVNGELAPRAIDLAFRIYMLPQGIFSVAVATILFPSLARLATRGDTDGFRRTSATGLRQIGFLLIPASAASAALATPIVRLVYQHGHFTPDQTAVVAQCLAAFSLGLAFNGAMLMLNRSFFSLQSPWIPTVVALGNLGLNAVLDAALYRFGVWGIPFATSFCNIAATLALLQLLRRKIGRIELTETIRSTALVLAASGALAVISHEAWAALDSLLGRSIGAQVVALLVALSVGVAAYVAACLLLGVRELRPLLSVASHDR